MINPSFNSPITKTIFEIENMRYRNVYGSTPPWLFYDIKNIIYLVESVSSARIEGNHTTMVSAAISSLENNKEEVDEVRQFLNVRRGLEFIEANVSYGSEITLPMIREFHKIIVDKLPIEKDGSKIPGAFKTENNKISRSKAKTTSFLHVEEELKDLLEYINTTTEPQFDILNIAIAHHRFTLIHPFDNGNGRVARLFTYAMLIQKGFINTTMTLNPSSIFCVDRQKYYDMLGLADKSLMDNNDSLLEEWCLYVAEGIKNEMERTSRLLNKDEVMVVISPVLRTALDRKIITEEEKQILEIASKEDVIQAKDITSVFGADTPANRKKKTRKLRGLVDRGLLYPKSKQKYVLTLSANKEILPILLDELFKAGLLAVD